jgi:signal transduction histidine kinase
METLDLAAMHGDALLTLLPVHCTTAERTKISKVAAIFFLDVLTPVENTRRATIENIAKLRQSTTSLHRCTILLMSTNRRLEVEVVHRKAAERSLLESEQTHRALLCEARQMHLRLRHLSHRVLSAQEEERKEISRELRGEVVQTLTGVNVQLASLKIEAGAAKIGLSRQISYTQKLVEKSVDIVHKFARDLRPTLLDDLGLIPALHAYMKSFTARTGLQVEFSTFSGVERMSNVKRTVLYRVALAALVNIAQHAKANTVAVNIKDLPQAVLMEIKDDGRSFDVTHALGSHRNKSMGLIGMRERVEMVGGTFRVDSAPGRGTTVSSMLPFQRSEQG